MQETIDVQAQVLRERERERRHANRKSADWSVGRPVENSRSMENEQELDDERETDQTTECGGQIVLLMTIVIL